MSPYYPRFRLKGKYNTAKIFTDVVDETSISQVMLLLNQEFVFNSKIRMMSDIHAGVGCTIGTTMTISDRIVPNLVGVDIGCGMEVIQIKEKHIELQKLDKLIYDKIPSGFNIRKKPHKYIQNIDLKDLYCYKQINRNRAKKSLGTLGGGNHFIEANKDNEGNIYIVIHSGSRHFGLEVANYYQNEGYKELNGSAQKDIDLLIKDLKAHGKQKEIQKSITTLKNTKRTNIPKQLAYVKGDLFLQYIHDMKIVQTYAELNRQAMIDEIVSGMNLHIIDQFTTIHNYIDTDSMILRKGAVSAKKNEKLLIPINMRDGSLICIGKGNLDWNESAPHGAGRLMSRSAAKERYTVSEFKKQMEGIFTTSVNRNTLDECPMAYKNLDDIVNNISDTVVIDKIIKPIYNFKAGGD